MKLDDKSLTDLSINLVKYWALIDVSPREFLPSEQALFCHILEALKSVRDQAICADEIYKAQVKVLREALWRIAESRCESPECDFCPNEYPPEAARDALKNAGDVG